MGHLVVGKVRCVVQTPWNNKPLMGFSMIATTLADILIPYHRSLHMHIEIVDLLRSHSVKFEVSREAINRWVTQPYLQEDGWEAFWEDLCEVEVDRWNNK